MQNLAKVYLLKKLLNNLCEKVTKKLYFFVSTQKYFDNDIKSVNYSMYMLVYYVPNLAAKLCTYCKLKNICSSNFLKIKKFNTLNFLNARTK